MSTCRILNIDSNNNTISLLPIIYELTQFFLTLSSKVNLEYTRTYVLIWTCWPLHINLKGANMCPELCWNHVLFDKFAKRFPFLPGRLVRLCYLRPTFWSRFHVNFFESSLKTPHRSCLQAVALILKNTAIGVPRTQIESWVLRHSSKSIPCTFEPSFLVGFSCNNPRLRVIRVVRISLIENE